MGGEVVAMIEKLGEERERRGGVRKIMTVTS